MAYRQLIDWNFSKTSNTSSTHHEKQNKEKKTSKKVWFHSFPFHFTHHICVHTRSHMRNRCLYIIYLILSLYVTFSIQRIDIHLWHRHSFVFAISTYSIHMYVNGLICFRICVLYAVAVWIYLFLWHIRNDIWLFMFARALNKSIVIPHEKRERNSKTKHIDVEEQKYI